jgi:hypothetical protein
MQENILQIAPIRNDIPQSNILPPFSEFTATIQLMMKVEDKDWSEIFPTTLKKDHLISLRNELFQLAELLKRKNIAKARWKSIVLHYLISSAFFEPLSWEGDYDKVRIHHPYNIHQIVKMLAYFLCKIFNTLNAYKKVDSRLVSNLISFDDAVDKDLIFRCNDPFTFSKMRGGIVDSPVRKPALVGGVRKKKNMRSSDYDKIGQWVLASMNKVY